LDWRYLRISDIRFRIADLLYRCALSHFNKITVRQKTHDRPFDKKARDRQNTFIPKSQIPDSKSEIVKVVADLYGKTKISIFKSIFRPAAAESRSVGSGDQSPGSVIRVFAPVDELANLSIRDQNVKLL
jgi:hypothetical protein